MNLTGKIITVIVLLTIQCTGSCQSSRIEDIVIQNRKVSVYIPANIKKDGKYPVLVFNDGQTCFGNGFNSLELGKIADSLIYLKLVQPFFIVAVHSNESRMDDYIPYEDSSIFYDYGTYESKAPYYVQFIRDEILPYIRLRFPVNDVAGIAGFSFGGLFASWAALNHPDLFSFSAAFSPSMWVADFEIFKDASLARADQIYYYDIGTSEWNYYLPFLKNSKLEPGRNIFYYEVKDAAHTIYHVKQRVHNALLLFAGKNDPSRSKWTVEKEVIESVVQPGRFYLRLNPVVEYKNGLRYSIFYNAKFTVENEETGMVNEDGSFHFKKPKDLFVTVSYNGKEQKIRIRYSDIEALKSKHK